MHRLSPLLLFIIVSGLTAGDRLPLPALDPALGERLKAYVRANGLPPEEYVLSKFRDHDVVFIGEYHRIRHDPVLIRDLVPLLYKSGIRILCIEFARREDQPLIDRVVEGAEYDEALAREVQFRSFPVWGYQEYVDLYRAAWAVNRSRPDQAPPFRILALGDSPDWSLIQQPEDWDNPEIRKKVWRGGGEQQWAQVILDQVVAKKEKALVYSGIHHAFTEYQQPIVDERTHRFVRFDSQRMGNFIFRAIGKRAFTIFLHAPWPASGGYNKQIYAADGLIDALIAELPAAQRRFGVDTHSTPFGEITGQSAVYAQGYDRFTVATFCDGYIVQKALSQYAGVTPIPGFINSSNLERARLGLPNPASRRRSAEELMSGVAADADMPRRLAHLQ